MNVQNNINLKVPFNEKDQAKSLGARWDAQAKLWYVPIGIDATPFEKWFSSSLNISSNMTPAQATIKPNAPSKAQVNVIVKKQTDDNVDDINALLREAYELNEDAF